MEVPTEVVILFELEYFSLSRYMNEYAIVFRALFQPIVDKFSQLQMARIHFFVMSSTEKEIESLKRAGRSNNIVVFGIEEKEKSTIELLRELKENIKQDLNIDIVNNEVNKIHRIGKKDPESNKPRPVICSFVNNWKKNEIIKSKKNLKNIYIVEDYSKEALKKKTNKVG
ncbi:hypothetical protein WA026_007421 [Henosepilachna vigintioctopunctata]|uniref:Uncharacterized protein n=1 Tax=Henosepilachna vigintioctopunctata TaxID=420089 RepID=A0AAW1UTV9_9CUCU